MIGGENAWGVTGAGAIVLDAADANKNESSCDPLPFLRSRKSRKYMGLQDDLAVVAAGRALESAGLSKGAQLGERAGLFIAVGYIPFREDDIGPVLESSMHDGAFDVKRFGAGGFQRAHPLLTFRCLPNMPAYHVSVSFDIQGPYCVTYPGPAQLYAVIEEAAIALTEGRIDIAIVGGVAAQSNFLVRHHFSRIDHPVLAGDLRDAAAMLVLETTAHARQRNAVLRANLQSMRAEYTPIGLAEKAPVPEERIDDHVLAEGLGPAQLAIALTSRMGTKGTLHHSLISRDGIRAESTWVISE